MINKYLRFFFSVSCSQQIENKLKFSMVRNKITFSLLVIESSRLHTKPEIWFHSLMFTTCLWKRKLHLNIEERERKITFHPFIAFVLVFFLVAFHVMWCLLFSSTFKSGDSATYENRFSWFLTNTMISSF